MKDHASAIPTGRPRGTRGTRGIGGKKLINQASTAVAESSTYSTVIVLQSKHSVASDGDGDGDDDADDHDDDVDVDAGVDDAVDGDIIN